MGLIRQSASRDFPIVDLGNPANAGPAVFSHLGKVFHAIKVNWDVSSFLTGGLFADGERLIDVINAVYFSVMRAVVGADLEREGYSQQGQQNQHNFHCRLMIIISQCSLISQMNRSQKNQASLILNILKDKKMNTIRLVVIVYVVCRWNKRETIYLQKVGFLKAYFGSVQKLSLNVKLVIQFYSIQFIFVQMGCVGNKPKQQQKSQQAAPNANPAGVPPPNDASPGRTGSAIKPPSKLTEEQVVKKRAEMRANLEEGHSKPPPVYIPHFEPISHIEE